MNGLKARIKHRFMQPVSETEIAWAWAWVGCFALAAYGGGRVDRGTLIALGFWPFITAAVLFATRFIQEVCRGTQ